MSPHVAHPLLLAVAALLAAAHLARLEPAGHYRKRRLAVLVFCRVVVAASFILVAGEVTLRYPEGRLNVVALADGSASMTGERAGVRDTVLEEARKAVGATGRFTAVRLPSGESDLEKALGAVGGLLEPGALNRVLLLSDGEETAGRAERAVPALREAGAQVLAWDLSSLVRPAAEIRKVVAPARVIVGERFEVKGVVAASGLPSVTVRLLRDGRPVGETEVGIDATGAGEAVFIREEERVGRSLFRFEVEAETDQGAVRGGREAEVETVGARSVAWLSDDPSSSAWLTGLLTRSGTRVEIVPPADLGWSWDRLAASEVIVLDDVAYPAIGPEAVERIEGLVREKGTGLVVVGGPRSLGAGEYKGTPLERILPVRMGSPRGGPDKDISLVVVLDTSLSMFFRGAGEASLHGTAPRKLDLAKMATLEVARALRDKDRLGVIASADAIDWVRRIGPVIDRGALEAAVTGLRAYGGGINFYSTLLEAVRALREEKSPIRHVMVLVDSNDIDQYEVAEIGRSHDLVREMEREGMTLSVFAVGRPTDKDIAFLKIAASIGRGDFYLVPDLSWLPRYFVSDYKRKADDWTREETFRPLIRRRSPLVRGIAGDGFPDLTGLNLVNVKEGGEEILSTPFGAPVLASWRYGRGKVTVFASDTGARWGALWRAWPEARVFWTQVMAGTAPRRAAGGVEASARVEEGEAAFSIFGLPGKEGPPLAVILEREGRSVRLPLRRSGLETWLAPAAGLPEGLHRFRVVPDGAAAATRPDDEGAGLASGTLDVPGPAETAVARPGRPVINALVEATGGFWLERPEDVVKGVPPPPRPLPDMTLWLLAAAMAALLGELVLRY
jgi:Ca-activated chloride channel family protein